MLARVPSNDIRRNECYEYFDGTTYQKVISKSKPVLTGMQHGTIYPSKLFQPNTGKDWVFVGCNCFADSTVQIGVAPKPEGPWDVRELIPAPPRVERDNASFTYCMYAHPWAYDEGGGELMVTWSEGGMQGKVVAVKVTLGQLGHGASQTEKEGKGSGVRQKLSLKDRILGKFRGDN
jgi:hypothetical protein